MLHSRVFSFLASLSPLLGFRSLFPLYGVTLPFLCAVVSLDFHCFRYLFFTRGALLRLLALGSSSAFGMCAIAPFPHTRPLTKGAVGCQWLHRIQRKVEGDVGQGPNHVVIEKAGESAPMSERE